MLPDVTALLADLTLLNDPAFLLAFLLLARAHICGPVPTTLASVVLVALMAAAASRLLPVARDALAAERATGAATAAARELATQLWGGSEAPPEDASEARSHTHTPNEPAPDVPWLWW